MLNGFVFRWVPEQTKMVEGYFLSSLGLLVPIADCDEHYHVLYIGECIAVRAAYMAGMSHYVRPPFGRLLQVGAGSFHFLYAAVTAAAAKNHIVCAEIGARHGVYGATTIFLAQKMNPGRRGITHHMITLEVDNDVADVASEGMQLNGINNHTDIRTGLHADEKKTKTLQSMLDGDSHVDILFWMPQVHSRQLVAGFNLETLNKKVCRVFVDLYQGDLYGSAMEVHDRLKASGWIVAYLSKPLGWYQQTESGGGVVTLTGGNSAFGPSLQQHFVSMMFVQPPGLDPSHACAGRILPREYELAEHFARHRGYSAPDLSWLTRSFFANFEKTQVPARAARAVCRQEGVQVCATSPYTRSPTFQDRSGSPWQPEWGIPLPRSSGHRRRTPAHIRQA